MKGEKKELRIVKDLSDTQERYFWVTEKRHRDISNLIPTIDQSSLEYIKRLVARDLNGSTTIYYTAAAG